MDADEAGAGREDIRLTAPIGTLARLEADGVVDLGDEPVDAQCTSVR